MEEDKKKSAPWVQGIEDNDDTDIQGDPSGSSKPIVDIGLKVAF